MIPAVLRLKALQNEVSRVAELCIGQDMGRLGAAMAFAEMRHAFSRA